RAPGGARGGLGRGTQRGRMYRTRRRSPRTSRGRRARSRGRTGPGTGTHPKRSDGRGARTPGGPPVGGALTLRNERGETFFEDLQLPGEVAPELSDPGLHRPIEPLP